MRTILIVLALVTSAAGSVEGRAKKTVVVEYWTESGWSEGFCRSVDFFAGSEIDFVAARKAGIKFMKNYAAVWFSEDQVALVELSGTTWFGKATQSSILLIRPWTGEDQNGREWRFSSDYTCR